jgi:hypothetical protein
MSEDKSLAVQEFGARSAALAAPQPQGFLHAPKDLAEAMEIAKLIASSTLCPEAFRGKPGDVVIVMMQSAQLGIPYFMGLKGIAVVNGRPTIWGDLGVALIQRSGKLEYMRRDWDEATQTATCTIKRRGAPETVRTFSMADAKRAGLDKKDTYQKYPQRLCGWRAATWAMRDDFADVLQGMTLAEEAMDYPSHEMPEPIGQPKPIAKLVGDFLAPAKADKKGGGAAAPPVAPTGGEKVTIVNAVTVKSGKSPKGSPWTLYKVTTSDGRDLATFSMSVFELAQEAARRGSPMLITTSPGKNAGQWNLDSIDPAPEEQGNDGPPDDGEPMEGGE